MNVSLHNSKVGFFGRTYKGKLIKLRLNNDNQDLISDEQDWVMFYTQFPAMDTKAIIEIILVEEDNR